MNTIPVQAQRSDTDRTNTTATENSAVDAFFRAYEAAENEAAENRAALLDEYCRQHPAIAERCRALAAQIDRLQAAAAATAAAKPADRLAPGHILGPFRIVRELAAGGMGVIYEARQVGLERRVALKTIRSDRASGVAPERFVREQRALALLHHTHIVPIFAAGTESGLQYYGMQFIPGVTLHELIGRLRTGGLALWNPSAGSKPASGAAPIRALPLESNPVPPSLSEQSIPTTFPAAYFRFAASLVAQAATALHSAHQRQVLHRDVKPANLMLDEQGKCWLIDFGLARLPAGDDARDGDALDAACAAMTQQAIGTQLYMSPEHFDLAADERSDIWSLGVVLYELLTLRRPFPGSSATQSRQLIEANAPAAPAQHVRNVPATLSAIFYKATQTRPGERYATAQELVEDLQNWLDFKPTLARPVSPSERFLLWTRRNPGRAWASAVATAMTTAAVVALLLASSADARLQATRANAAIERAALAEQGQQAQQREILMRDLVQLRLSTHTAGWTQKADELIAKIAPLGVDEDLRTQAASCLMGLDAHHVAGFTDAPAWSVALSPDGKYLLTSDPRGIGVPPRGAGVSPADLPETAASTPTRLLEIATNQITDSQLAAPSVVTFLPDGTPLQIALPTAANASFQLWDVRTQASLGDISPPDGWTTDGLTFAVSRDGTLLAVAGHRGAGVSPALESEPLATQPHILLLDLQRRQCICELAAPATALALADQGQLLAVGDAAGQVAIYSLPDLSLVSRFTADRGRITALDLCKSPLVPRNDPRPALRHYLAVAAAGGSLAVWNLETGTVVNHFRGSAHGIHAVAISEDGTTLLSCGRNLPRVWDVPTGRLLLQCIIDPGDWFQGCELSALHGIVAVCRAHPGREYGGCQIYGLENGRGVQTLRGLRSQIAQVWFSPDDSLIGGLSHLWDLGVWELATGRLLQVFETPIGKYTDNADAAFSADGRRLAFATSGEACCWDLTNAAAVQRWKTNPGFCEQVAFLPEGDLVAAQWAQGAGNLPPGGAVPSPFVRYSLPAGSDRSTVQLEFGSRFGRANDADLSADGRTLIIDGRGTGGPETRTIAAFAFASGERLWTLPVPLSSDNGLLHFNRSGSLAYLQHAVTGDHNAVIEIASGQIIRSSPYDKVGAASALALSSDGRMTFGSSYLRMNRDWSVFRASASDSMPSVPLCTITFDDFVSGLQRAEFSFDDQRVAWGGPAGEVIIAEIPAITQTLDRRGLDMRPTGPTYDSPGRGPGSRK